jgi:para-aminobenzoate synthetase component 1
LRTAFQARRLDPRDRPADHRFVGGWVGWIGYEIGASFENVGPAATDDISPLPAMRWAFYDTVACYDRQAGQWTLSALVLDDENHARTRLDELEARLRQGLIGAFRATGGWSASVSSSFDGASDEVFPREATRTGGQAASGTNQDPCRHAQTPQSSNGHDSAECNMTRRQYESAVVRALEYIGAGDIYQVNVAQRFSWPASSDPGQAGRLFAAMRRNHPAEFSAFLAWRDQAGRPAALCSASPELFLAVHGDEVVTQPIKGTRRRTADECEAHATGQLLASVKDAAELAMIVDLERNDLGRVCRFGSVQVTEPRAITTLPHVHHTVATIRGRLAEGRDLVDLLAATFPGGSITGAPKVRAMQIIAELEPAARSAYTGAIGYVGIDGSAVLNIAIRTAIVAGGQVHLHVGAGIVADSDPSAEYDETLAKAEGIAQAIAEVTRDGDR